MPKYMNPNLQVVQRIMTENFSRKNISIDGDVIPELNQYARFFTDLTNDKMLTILESSVIIGQKCHEIFNITHKTNNETKRQIIHDLMLELCYINDILGGWTCLNCKGPIYHGTAPYTNMLLPANSNPNDDISWNAVSFSSTICTICQTKFRIGISCKYDGGFGYKLSANICERIY